jgi:hypothetical protein
MRLFATFRDDRTLLRRSAAFADSLMAEPAESEVAWLAEKATRGDVDHARWELRYLRRALGILVAQRDALDDRTPSVVLRALMDRMHRDQNVDEQLRELAERQFNARLSAYRDALTSRGHGTPALRVAQNLLAFAGGPIRSDDPVVRHGATLVEEAIGRSNAQLRATFGEPELPEDVRPSEAAVAAAHKAKR